MQFLPLLPQGCYALFSITMYLANQKGGNEFLWEILVV